MTEWVSLSEAAELEELPYNTVTQNYIRNKYRFRTEPNPEGGKALVFIDVSSLSLPAQAKYKRRKQAEIQKLRAKRIRETGEPPWYVDCDFSWYYENYKSTYQKAQGLAAVIEKYLRESAEYHKTKTEFCEEFVSKNLSISSKQFRRYLKKYKEATAWASAQESEDGKNYDYFRILSLCPPPKKGKHTRLTEELRADIENLWASEKYQKNLQSIQLLCEDLWDWIDDRGDEYKPSYNTVRRYCQDLYYNHSDVAVYLQKGERNFKAIKMIKMRRDIASLEVMECVMGDAHTFDCWIEVTDENGNITAARPYLVGFIDVRSRVLVGWGITLQPNAEAIKQVVIHMIYPKKNSPFYGVPRVVYIDNGKDFTAETLTGRKRKVRFDIDGEIKGFYKSIGIEYDKRALPYHSWVKGQIERVFGTIISRFTKKIDSYTGTLTGSKTAGKVLKDIPKMLKAGQLLNMEEFTAAFEDYLAMDYHKRNHSGLKEDGAEVPTPEWVFLNEKRYQKAAPPIEYAITLLGQCTTRTVYSTGIRIENITYSSQELARFIGEKILVRYYKKNLGFVCCYTISGEHICNAYTAEKLNPLAEFGDETLTEHLKSQARQMRQMKADRNALKMPYEQRELQLPELSEEPQKVFAIPQDRQWSEQKKKERERQEQKTTEFMRKQAEKAFRRIENLG